jgi:hypothetical protein
MSEKLEKKPFINRKAEKEYLVNYFSNIPDSILFVY